MKTDKKQLHQEMKRNFLIERLLDLGISKSQTGKSVHELDYETLKYELVLAEMRQVDIEHPEHRWFR
ncbi:hypothetical protein [Neobacillus sedimentimangrovi]|jgi:hypothetical protein|uniref:hypothetical protein n=1 Tax=Neobacillus sedimentimangrovi TaxID=2699460 RepID=UPI0013D076A0|nr:hypothetical protein [Neobacillus sedimentimangrovi]